MRADRAELRSVPVVLDPCPPAGGRPIVMEPAVVVIGVLGGVAGDRCASGGQDIPALVDQILQTCFSRLARC